MIAPLLLTLLFGRVLAADEAASYDLRQLLEAALERDAEIEAARWQVAGARARLRKAQAARYLPRLRLQGESGLVPEAKGDIFNPPSDTLGVRPLGPFLRAGLEFVQPLYPIDRGRQLQEAASKGVGVERADLRAAQLATAREIKKLYYGLLLARDLQELVQRLVDELERRQGESAGDDALPMSSRYKLELALLELEGQRREARDQAELARAALAWHTGLPAGEALVLRARWLAPVVAQVPPLEELLQRALPLRPDWRKLQAGMAAKQALQQAARQAYKPQIYLSGGLRYAVAPGRTDQRNPFVKDEFNFFNGGVFLGLRQSLEWHLLAADLDKARAEYRQLAAREESARRGIHLDIRRAYSQYQRAAAGLEDARASRRLARQWLREAQEEYEFDPEQIKELIAAFENWAQFERKYYRAIYDFNMSIAKLEEKCGGLELGRENPAPLRDE